MGDNLEPPGVYSYLELLRQIIGEVHNGLDDVAQIARSLGLRQSVEN